MLRWIIRAMLRPPQGRSSRSDHRRLPPKIVPVQRRSPSSRTKNPRRQASLEAFDPATAKPQRQRQVVSGRAYVVDGDTIKIRNIQIRLFGIDAPEMNHPYGRAAKNALYCMCRGQTIHAEVLETDDHGRKVAVCRFDDGRDLSAEMVKLGLAIDWPKYSGGGYEQFETPEARKKLYLADARQKGRMYLWYRYDVEARRGEGAAARDNPEPDQALCDKDLRKCPRCGATMVKRAHRRTGTKFWGCSTYPKCRGSRDHN
jgi:micrococcal nuclease